MMKFPYQLSAVLMGVAICLVQPQMILALTPREVEAIAKGITVRIDGESAGSGVIIDRQGNKYFVLTNRHVVNRPGRYEIQTPDGKRYPVYYKQEIPGLDLAVLQFESDNSYNTAKLGNSDEMTGAIAVYVSGWADKLPGVNERTYQFSGGQITSRLQNPENGYALMFTNPTIPGTSGGPMLDEDGRLVGINGKATFDQTTQRTFSFGIPINSYQSARNTLKPLEESSPTLVQQPTAESLISLGGSKANQGDYQGALAYYNQALRLDSNNVDAYFRRAYTRFQLGDQQGSIEDITRVIKLSPDNSSAYFFRGIVRAGLGDFQAAARDIEKAISLDANNALFYWGRGLIRNAQEDPQGAIADFTESIRLQPDYLDAYKERANTYKGLKNYPAAIADYNKALSFLEYSGIGVRFGSNETNQGLLITEVFENYPASKQGINAGDQILAINGESTLNKSDEELVQLIDRQIRNEAVTQVTLRIRQEGKRDLEVKLTKTKITNPESASIYYLRGGVRKQLKDYEGAISDFTQAIERKPDYVDAHNDRGIIYYNREDYQKAIADYNRAIQIKPDYAHAYYNLGQSYRKLGEKQKALESYQKAAELYKKQGDTENYQDALERISALQGTATSPPEQRDYQAEIAAANLAIKKNPNDAEAYLDRAVAYYNLGDKQKALQDLVQATRLNPKYSLAWYNRGWLLAELGRNEEAIISLNNGIQANTEWGNRRSLTDAYNLRCAVRNQIGDYQKAIDDCNQALRLNPKYYNAYVNRGLALVGQGKVQEAIEDYNRAIQLDPNNLWAYDRRGEAHADQGDYQGAIADYTEIIRLDDKNVVAYALRGMNYQRLGDTQEAIKDFNQAIQLDPNNAVALAVRGLSYHLQGDYIGSLAAYEASVTKDPKFYLAIANIGLVKYELGDMEAAMTQFEKALAIDKNSAEIQLALGVALYTSGNQPRGLAMAEKALQRDKRFANVEFLKKNLWGERIIADTQKLLETPRIQELLKKLKTGS